MSSIALARVYQQSFDAHPYTTLAITNGVMGAFSDVVAQVTQRVIQPPRHEDDRQRFDFARTARFFAFGLGMGPIIGRWNLFLERNFPLRMPSFGGRQGNVSLKALGKRVAADQILMAPVGLALFLGSMGVMEGRDGRHIREKFQDLYKPLLITNWQVWPTVQLINFRFMPLPYRVPFQSTAGIFWTLYLSIANSKENSEEDHRDQLRKTLDSKA
ncbi:Mpv17/PMP22 family protein [Phanerochaete sordida]|uniref:Mpv17/PMP22 family protein n=1 Tax=Phanerochaete sordida TaxID=48140 RepID=A0A9P3G4N9_9APHY|nr:Mpv17/PMP22 family protein [Phanerochaete sordida]